MLGKRFQHLVPYTYKRESTKWSRSIILRDHLFDRSKRHVATLHHWRILNPVRRRNLFAYNVNIRKRFSSDSYRNRWY